MLTIVITSSETKSDLDGGFHLFNDVAKYGRTNNRLEERSGDIKPNEVGVSGNNDASNSEEKPVGVSVSNKANKESSNEALMLVLDTLGDVGFGWNLILRIRWKASRI
nr:hypothetical protein [Tanacetum cinerariifolium]